MHYADCHYVISIQYLYFGHFYRQSVMKETLLWVRYMSSAMVEQKKSSNYITNFTISSIQVNGSLTHAWQTKYIDAFHCCGK